MLCSFDLEVLGGDITLLPGLEAWLNSLIRTSVLRFVLFCKLKHFPLISNLITSLLAYWPGVVLPQADSSLQRLVESYTVFSILYCKHA